MHVDDSARCSTKQVFSRRFHVYTHTIIIIVVIMSATAVPRGPNERGRVEHDGRVLAQQVEPTTDERWKKIKKKPIRNQTINVQYLCTQRLTITTTYAGAQRSAGE